MNAYVVSVLQLTTSARTKNNHDVRTECFQRHYLVRHHLNNRGYGCRRTSAKFRTSYSSMALPLQPPSTPAPKQRCSPSSAVASKPPACPSVRSATPSSPPQQQRRLFSTAAENCPSSPQARPTTSPLARERDKHGVISLWLPAATSSFSAVAAAVDALGSARRLFLTR